MFKWLLQLFLNTDSRIEADFIWYGFWILLIAVIIVGNIIKTRQKIK